MKQVKLVKVHLLLCKLQEAFVVLPFLGKGYILPLFLKTTQKQVLV